MTCRRTPQRQAPPHHLPFSGCALRFNPALLWVAPTTLAGAALSVPILVVAASLFRSSGDVWRHLYATALPDYVLNSLALALGVGCLVLPMGTIPAWLVTRYRFPLSRRLEWALLLPLAFPAYIVAYAYTGLLDASGPVQTWLRTAFSWQFGDYWFPDIRSLPGAVLVLALVLYPYVYLLARAAFKEQGAAAVEVAATLGLRPAAAFFRAALPLARPAVCVGLSLALMETLADYGAVQYFGVAVFTTGIFKTWFGMGNDIAAAQLSAVLMLFVLSLLVMERRWRRQSRYYHAAGRHAPLQQEQLHGRSKWLALALCAAPVVLGFVVPGARLLSWARQTWRGALDAGFPTLAWHSIELALLTSGAALILALAVAYAARLQPGMITRSVSRLAGMGYAVPGTVIAVGVLAPFAWLDRRLERWLSLFSSADYGLLLSGTVAILVAAYLVRFMAPALHTVDAGLAKITPSLDEAGRCAGVTGFALWRRVHAPILRGSLLVALLLVFVDVLKELPATLVLRPFNFNTLAVRTYELANEERLADAAVPALAIVLAGLLPVILLSRGVSRPRIGHDR